MKAVRLRLSALHCLRQAKEVIRLRGRVEVCEIHNGAAAGQIDHKLRASQRQRSWNWLCEML